MKGLLHKGMIVNLFDYWVYGQFDVPINPEYGSQYPTWSCLGRTWTIYFLSVILLSR